MANDEVWRCDLKSPCVKYCESKNNKHQCGIYKRDNMKKYIVVIKNITNQEYRKIVGTRNTMKKAEELEYIMIGRIGIDYYIDIEVQDEI